MKQLSLEEIQERARSGPIYLLSRRGAALVISFLTTLTIARLLTPRDYGLAAMSTVVLAFMQTFRDFGLTNATLRKGHIDQEELSFLFWFNTFATLAMALLIAAASPLIANFYAEPAVRDIVLVTLIGFVVGGCSLQHNAIMRRDLRFGMVAAVDTFSLLAGFIVGLTVAFLRRDYWALVASGLAQSFVSAIINIWATRWQPGRPRMIAEAGELFRFGANSSLYSLLNFASRYSSTIMIGRWLGPVSLGHFNRAYDLYQLPFNNLLRPIAQSTLPVLARLRPTPDLYRINYLAYVERLSCTLIPACVTLSFCGVPLVHLLLGDKWTVAGELLSILAPALAVYGVIYPISDLLVSQGRSADMRTIGIWDLGLRTAGVAAGLNFGLDGAAFGFTCATLLMMPMRIQIAGRTGPVTRRDQYQAILPAVPIGLAVMAGSAAGRTVAGIYSGGDIWTMALVGSGAFIGFIAGALPFRSSREAVKSVIAMLTGRYRITVKSPATDDARNNPMS